MADENPLAPTTYLNDNRTTINWGKLLTTVVGGAIFAWYQGVAGLVLALADFPIAIANTISYWIGRLIRTLFGPLGDGLYQAWIQALPIVQSSGILAFVVSITILLTATYAFWRILRTVIGRG